MSSSEFENVYPDTEPLLRHARSLSPRSAPPLAYASIGALLRARAEAQPDKPWLIYHDDEGTHSRYTYREFFEAARRVARYLTDAAGLKAGDRVATLMVNDPRTVLVYFAAWMVGLTVVPINCSEDDERIAFIIKNSEAQVVFAHGDSVERCEGMRHGLESVREYVQAYGELHDGFSSFEAILSLPPLDELPDMPATTECLIVYTSGTTGAPKGVVLEHGNLLADADSINSWHRLGPDDRAMCVLPIHHVNGTVVTLVTPLYGGGSIVLNRRFRAQTFWKILAAEKCTWTSVVPTVLAFLCEQHESLADYDLSRFRHIICGAGPLTVELARKFETAFGVRVVHGYGLSETTCYSSFLPIDLDRPAYLHWMLECGLPSIGCPISANQMAIHDAGGTPLQPDVRGEIVARGANVMKYYFKRPDANRDAFAHGWFRTGDEGFYRVGADGRSYYFITGRIKELIIRGGVNYSPFDIDEVLNAIPGVKAAMAVGFENEFYGEEVGAYVQLEAAGSLIAEQILAACRERLPFAKSPKVVVFGDTFPVTSTGKYQRSRLRPLFAEWKSVQFRERKTG